MSLASPSYRSARPIPPSVYPVVPSQRGRLGLRHPGTAPGSMAPPEAAQDASDRPAPGRGGWWRRLLD